MPSLTFKATEDEARAIREAARRRRVNLSAYDRSAALAAAKGKVAGARLVRSPATGALVVSAGGDSAVLTDEMVCTELEQFP